MGLEGGGGGTLQTFFLSPTHGKDNAGVMEITELKFCGLTLCGLSPGSRDREFQLERRSAELPNLAQKIRQKLTFCGIGEIYFLNAEFPFS